jgi:hypothetical protein
MKALNLRGVVNSAKDSSDRTVLSQEKELKLKLFKITLEML